MRTGSFRFATSWGVLVLALLLLNPLNSTAQETSCAGRCGQSASATGDCGCDSICQQFGDCCSDYASSCAGGTTLGARMNSGGLVGELITNLRLLRGALRDDQYHLAVYFQDFFATHTSQARSRVKDWVSQYNWCGGGCRADWMLDYLYTAVYDNMWTSSLEQLTSFLEQEPTPIMEQVVAMMGTLPSPACTTCLLGQSDGPYAALGEYALAALGYLAAQRGLSLIPSSATTTTTTYTTTTVTTTTTTEPGDGDTTESYLRRGVGQARMSPFRF